jgi:leader peptidase (prepilin peptidase)/N-methyltransferase
VRLYVSVGADGVDSSHGGRAGAVTSVSPWAVGSFLALAALLGVAAAWWLRGRRYRLDDDVVLRTPSPWWVPVLAVVGTFLAVPFWTGESFVILVTYELALVWASTLAVIDLEVRRLPDMLVLPAYPVAAVLLGAAAAVTGDGWALLRAATCAGVAVVVYLAAALLAPGVDGLGLGDVKLAGVLAALLGWFGWYTALVGLAAGFVLGGLAALGLLLTRRADRRSTIAFGPSMILGAYLCGLLAPIF